MSEETWCEHIFWDGEFWFRRPDGKSPGPRYLFCERCGAKRPEEKRDKLANILEHSVPFGHFNTWDIVAEKALKAVEEVIDEACDPLIRKSWLKQRLRELL